MNYYDNPFYESVSRNELFLANREYKSSLFAYLLLKNKKHALSVCNALKETNYTNEEEIQYELLEDVLFVKLRNDVSFIFDKSVHLYEHQSTFNANMPLRGFMYFADLYKKLVDKKKLLRSTLVKIPAPEYVVFYNGTDKSNVPDKQLLRLSDAFDTDKLVEGFEWTATMININHGHNEEFLSKCKVLDDYSKYIECVRKYSCHYELKDAILKAIDECIKKDILREELQGFRDEVAYMTFTEFDEEELKKEVEAEIQEMKEEVKALEKMHAAAMEEIAENKAKLADKDAKLAEQEREIARLRKLLEQ